VTTTTATLTSGSGGNPVTVANAGDIALGAYMFVSVGFAAGATVTAVAGTSITLNNNPSASGAATLTFIKPDSGAADPDYGIVPNQPHPNVGGYRRMADIVRFPRV
jgi:hypothetical protein